MFLPVTFPLFSEILYVDRQVPRKPRPRGWGQEAQYIREVPYREALRYTQGRELCRTATPFRAWSFIAWPEREPPYLSARDVGWAVAGDKNRCEPEKR